MSLADIMQSHIDKCVHGGYFSVCCFVFLRFTATYKLKRKRDNDKKKENNERKTINMVKPWLT